MSGMIGAEGPGPVLAAAPPLPSLGDKVATAVGAGYAPDEITSFLMSQGDPTTASQVQTALKAGYSPAEIVDHLNPRADKINVQGIPVLAPIDRGIAHLREGAANLATDLGATGVGSYIRQSIPTATLAASTSGAALSDDLANRRYLSALGNLPSAVLEQAAPVAGAVVAGTATGGSLPAVLGTGAAIGAGTQGDAIARQRAVNNGRAAPDASDLAVGLGAGVGIGATGTIGLGGVGGGLAQAAGRTVLHGAVDAAQPELTALAGSVGTAQGAQNASPQDIAAAGLTGLGTRGALAAPDLVNSVAASTPAARAAARAQAYAALSPEAQNGLRNTAAAQTMLDTAKASVVPMPGGAPADPAVARTVGDTLDRSIGGLSASLEDQGIVGPTGVAAIEAAHQAAADPGRALLRQHLDALDGIGLDPGTAQTLKDAISQRNMLSSAGVDPDPSLLGSIAGVGPRLVGRAVHAFLPGPAALIANAALGHIGNTVAARFGLTDPTLAKAAANASAMLDAAGQPVPDTLQRLQGALSQSQDVLAAQQRIMDQQRAADAAQAQQFKSDYGDAQAMNRQFDANQRTIANGQYADAQAMNRQFDASQNFQRAQEVGDAQAIDAQRTRGINLLEREGGKVAMMALRRAQAQAALGGGGTPDQGGPSAPSVTPSPVPSPMEAAANRAQAAQALNAPAPSRSGPDLTAPVPETSGFSAAAALQGQGLPAWQHSLGEKLSQALLQAGAPANLNYAHEATDAVNNLVVRQWFSRAFGDQLLAHRGSVVKGVYDAIRQEMFLKHSIDRRTLAAQQATSPTP